MTGTSGKGLTACVAVGRGGPTAYVGAESGRYLPGCPALVFDGTAHAPGAEPEAVITEVTGPQARGHRFNLAGRHGDAAGHPGCSKRRSDRRCPERPPPPPGGISQSWGTAHRPHGETHLEVWVFFFFF